MSSFRIAAKVRLKEGYDMSRIKMELANDLGTDYRLKNVHLEDDVTSTGNGVPEQPAHILTYELSGDLTPDDIQSGLEQTRDKLGMFEIEALNIENE